MSDIANTTLAGAWGHLPASQADSLGVGELFVRPRLNNLGQALAMVARQIPDRVAIRLLSGESLTFEALEVLSARVAAWLCERGVSAGNVVGILHDKTPLPYAIMLACLRLGAIYVNLDTKSPPDRVRTILAQAQPCLLLHSADNRDLIEALAPTMDCEAADYSSPDWIAGLESVRAQPTLDVVPGHAPAYLMFTSGSTGQPKGVVISHQSVLNFIQWGHDVLKCGVGDVVTNINPMYFDNSVFDFYVTLFNGATLVPIPDSLAKHPRRMIKEIERLGCTLWFSVPSMLVYVLRMRALETDDLPALRALIFGGEGFPKPALRELHRLLGSRVELVNVYGPTECTCICSSYTVRASDLEDDALLPLGPMAPNFTHLIVDESLRPVEPGAVGELLIGGSNVGLGYYRDLERTAAAFIQNPLHADYRDILYRSGDHVYWNADLGALRFVGRRDHQIKRMGYRIELGEIEAALQSLPEVAEGVCVSGPLGAQVAIHACVVAPVSAVAAVEAGLRQRLPSYMIPNEIVCLSALPRNTNGKIDRVALQQMCMECVQ